MRSDFDADAATSIGTIRGARAFDHDRLGRLVGVTIPQVFRPGENVATCRSNEIIRGAQLFPLAAPKTHPKGRPAGAAGCSCGYWAYTDGTLEYAQTDRWSAVIEGYGLVTRGKRGFRAEKARIAALVPPVMQTPMTWRTADMYGQAGIPIYPTMHAALDEHPVILDLPDPYEAGFWDQVGDHTSPSDLLQQAARQVGYIQWPGNLVGYWTTTSRNRSGRPLMSHQGCTCALCR